MSQASASGISAFPQKHTACIHLFIKRHLDSWCFEGIYYFHPPFWCKTICCSLWFEPATNSTGKVVLHINFKVTFQNAESLVWVLLESTHRSRFHRVWSRDSLVLEIFHKRKLFVNLQECIDANIHVTLLFNEGSVYPEECGADVLLVGRRSFYHDGSCSSEKTFLRYLEW